MTTIVQTREQVNASRVHVVTWGPMATSDVGDNVEMPNSADRSIQVDGTFGGATIILQGSNDGVTWFTLTSPDGTACSFTSAGLKQVLEVVRYMRPSVTGGTSVALYARLLIKGETL